MNKNDMIIAFDFDGVLCNSIHDSICTALNSYLKCVDIHTLPINKPLLTSEVFPFAKTGGLADVSGALPFALAKHGIDVKVFMPLYKGIKPEKIKDGYGISKVGGVDIIFIKNDEYFLRDSLYTTKNGDYPDNLERFSFFSEKIIAILKKLKFET